MPDKPTPEFYDVMRVGEETYAVVYDGTDTVVVLDGVPQVGFDIQDAYDVAESLEAIRHIMPSRVTRTVN
ncbi:hypothetical protein [Lichenibacterium dinghuense]|uniref:hypothetical protein n=1 Tax=Lichenibacterium dinghuense TaxID=2895977 RepID=UPI001F48C31B|nr:hypothetical protein [Lichenibacterium sp. 6Y81]